MDAAQKPGETPQQQQPTVVGQPVPAQRPPGATSACGTIAVMVVQVLFILFAIIGVASPVFTIQEVPVGGTYAISSSWRTVVTFTTATVDDLGGGPESTSLAIDEWDKVPGLKNMAGPLKTGMALMILNIFASAFLVLLQGLRLCKVVGSSTVWRVIAIIVTVVMLVFVAASQGSVTNGVESNIDEFMQLLLSGTSAYAMQAHWAFTFALYWLGSYAMWVCMLVFSIRTCCGKSCCCSCCTCAYVDDELPPASLDQPGAQTQVVYVQAQA